MKEEGMQETANKLIHIGKPIDFNEKEFFEQLKDLKSDSKIEAENEEIRGWVQKIVPTYQRKVIEKKAGEEDGE